MVTETRQRELHDTDSRLAMDHRAKWHLSDEYYRGIEADMVKELEASQECNRLVSELVNAVGPIVNWGGDEPGDSIVYMLVSRLIEKYGGWEPDKGKPYKKATIPKDMRSAIMERDGWRCLRCGSKANLSIDHIFPERLGGATHPANLRVLCMDCNRSKGTKLEMN